MAERLKRKRVKVLPTISEPAEWYVVTVPDLNRLAGPYPRMREAVDVKNGIQAVLDEGYRRARAEAKADG